ncbi:MAG: RidA family protein [Geodermatophilaceae bacterium]|nr:RidA family protein [Geodermatophilaceae bacterium]
MRSAAHTEGVGVTDNVWADAVAKVTAAQASRLKRINPPESGKPSGFSHAVVAPPGARVVFLAGQTAMDSAGQIVGTGDVVAQFEQALGNLLAALRAAGGQPEHLTSLTIYAVDLADYRAHSREIRAVWRRLIGNDYPAMAGIGIARLWDDSALVEVQGIAALPPA